MTWVERAACQDVPTDKFFPEPATAAAYRYPRTICQSCPVRQACLDAAMGVEGELSADSRFGLLGGLTPRERARKANANGRSRKFGGPIATPIVHGTVRGYWKHQSQGVAYCDPCRAAGVEYARAKTAARQAAS